MSYIIKLICVLTLDISTRWMTYEEADSIADSMGRGLRMAGQQPGEAVCMFADTR